MRISDNLLEQSLKNMDWQKDGKIDDGDFDYDCGIGIAEVEKQLHDPKNEFMLDYSERVTGVLNKEYDTNSSYLSSVEVEVKNYQLYNEDSVIVNLTDEQEKTICDWIESYSE